jgi:hypothetical protein
MNEGMLGAGSATIKEAFTSGALWRGPEAGDSGI